MMYFINFCDLLKKNKFLVLLLSKNSKRIYIYLSSKRLLRLIYFCWIVASSYSHDSGIYNKMFKNLFKFKIGLKSYINPIDIEEATFERYHSTGSMSV